MKAVILIPYRGVNDYRVRNLKFVTDWYRPLGWPITLGDSRETPFNRAASRNAAAAGAGEWDVALIADADCIADLSVVRRAAAQAIETERLVLPHDDYFRLSQKGSDQFVGNPERYPLTGTKLLTLIPNRTRLWQNMMPSGAIVVTSFGFRAIGGYDEGFKTWGYEDGIFLDDAKRLIGVDRLPGPMIHLWHPLDTGTIDNRSVNRQVALDHHKRVQSKAP